MNDLDFRLRKTLIEYPHKKGVKVTFDHLDKYITKIIKREPQTPTENQLFPTPMIEPIELFNKKKKVRRNQKSYNTEKNNCVICNKEIVGRSNIVKHYKIHADQKKKKNTDTANKTDHNGLLQCSTCLEEFLDKDDLRNHEDHFHISKPFMCSVCNKCFASAQNYMFHMESHRKCDELKKCPDCDFTTTFPLAFTQHINSHPKLDNPFMCQFCGACFIVRKDLNAHRRNEHLNMKKTTIFQCNICQKQYTRKARLKDHIKTHTGQAREKRICDICGKSISFDHMTEHMRVHTGYKPYSCTYCEKKFTTRLILRDHIRVHSGEKPFACEYCGKCFSQRTPLTIHLRLHTGERPYKCTICEKGFVSKGALDNHVKNGKH